MLGSFCATLIFWSHLFQARSGVKMGRARALQSLLRCNRHLWPRQWHSRAALLQSQYQQPTTNLPIEGKLALPRIAPSLTIQRTGYSRAFSTSQCLHKKGGKQAREEARQEKQSTPSSSQSSSADDPFDFSTLEADIAASIERLRANLSKLRAGGRFNLEALEDLRVQPDKKSNQTVKLTDLAPVVPKGRTAQIMVGEQEHVKPIMTAIQTSDLSLTPQPDPSGQNPLMLVVNIPPPTTERRRAAVAEAAKAGEKAGTGIRDARGRQQKKMRGMQLGKSVRPDDLKKAQGLMEKVAEKGQAEVKSVVEAAKKVLESG